MGARLDRFVGVLREAFGSKSWGTGLAGSSLAYPMDVALRTANWTPRKYDRLSDEGFKKNVIANRCVTHIAQSVSQAAVLCYNLKADGSRTENHEHQVAALLRRPNPMQSRAQLLFELTASLVIGGNAYVEGIGPVTGRRMGQFTELWVQRPDRIRVLPGQGGRVAGYRREAFGETKEWPVDPVTMRCALKHIKLFNPTDDWYGLAPLEVAAMDIDTHNKTREWNKSLLDNAARPEGILLSDSRMSDQQFQRYKRELREDYSGPRHAGRPMVLDGGVTWQQLSFSPRDMDFLNSRHTSARDIALAFGVPPMLLGIPGDNTYSNMQEARLGFLDETVVFYLSLLVSELGGWMLAGQEALELGYDLDSIPAMAVRRGQLFERAEAASFLKVDEKRDLAGYGKLEDGKGDVLLVSNSMKPLEQVLEPAPPQPPQPGAVEAEEGGDEPDGGAAEGAPKPTEDDDTKTAKAARFAALRDAPHTLKAARDVMACSAAEFALWLVSEEGLSVPEAKALAALTEVAAAPAAG